MEYNPRAVFEKLFGDSGSTERGAREARMRQHKSMLDSVTREARRPEARPRPAGSGEGRRVHRVGARRRAAHPAGRGAGRGRAAGAGSAAGRAAGLRGSPGADARPADAGVPVRPDARHHVHAQQGAERAAVSADRRARGAPSAVAPQQRSRSWSRRCRRSTAITRSCSRSISPSCARRPTATARCSTT